MAIKTEWSRTQNVNGWGWGVFEIAEVVYSLHSSSAEIKPTSSSILPWPPLTLAILSKEHLMHCG